MATDGTGRILDIEPTDLHQRTPLYIGSKSDVDIALSMIGKPVVDETPVAAR